MKFITSWDDGHVDDLHLARILKKYGVDAIFYIPSTTLLSVDEIRSIAKNFEIGGHTVNHPSDLKMVEQLTREREIKNNRKWLQEITGQEVKSFCYPRGRYNQEVIDAVKDAGFTEARTTQVMNIVEPDELEKYQIKTSVHVYPTRKEYKGRPWFEVAEELYNQAEKNNGYFHMWGHSWELGKFGLWGELDTFLKFVSSN